MAVNKVVYGGEILIDTSGVTVTKDTLAEGVTALNAAGEEIVGSMQLITIDDALSQESTNPVQNKVVTAAIESLNKTTGELVDRVQSYSEGLSYSLNDDGASYSVSGSGDCQDTIVVIPNSYNGLPVTEIGLNALYGYRLATRIVLPNSITKIGTCAFDSCSSLVSINIPDTVTKIGDAVFRYCGSLESIVIPKSVTTMGNAVFKSNPTHIYSEWSSKPDGWYREWNAGCPVTWGYRSNFTSVNEGINELNDSVNALDDSVNELSELSTSVNELKNKIDSIASVRGTWCFNKVLTSAINVVDTEEKYQQWTNNVSGAYPYTLNAYWTNAAGERIYITSFDCVEHTTQSADVHDGLYGIYIFTGSDEWIYESKSWPNQLQRKVTILEEPSEEVAAWVRANAVKVNDNNITDNSAGASFALPMIRFANLTTVKEDDYVVAFRFTVENLGGGTLQVGDKLQICCKRKYVGGKYKLRCMAEVEITEDDLNYRFLKIEINPRSNNVQKWLYRNDHSGSYPTMSLMYFRLKRVTKYDDSGDECNAIFSNVEQVWKTYTGEIDEDGVRLLNIK